MNQTQSPKDKGAAVANQDKSSKGGDELDQISDEDIQQFVSGIKL
jgi:hypothetical protein